MPSNDQRTINEFTKLLKNLSENSSGQAKTMGEILTLTRDQLRALRDLAGATSELSEFTAEQTETVFKSQKEEAEFNDEMIRKQEELESMMDENLKDLQDAMFDSNDLMEEVLSETIKANKTTKKAEKERKKQSKAMEGMSKGVSHFAGTAHYLSELSGISSLANIFPTMLDAFKSELGILPDLLSNVVMKPIKGIGSIAGGLIGSMLGLGARETEESNRAEDVEMNEMMLEALQEIESNTSPKKEMIKGGSFMDFLKGLLPKGMFGGGFKMGGALAKFAGAGMILGGLVWMVSDFMDGFKEGGVGQGLYRAFVGKSEGTIKGALKNAGKFALIGAGIGTMIAPVIGTIAGGLIGGAIGLLVNVVAGIVKSPGSVSSKLSSFFLGEGSGAMASVFNGMKYASMGALLGTAIAPGVGTIVGGIVGFVVGFLIDFVRQILPQGLKDKIAGLFKWVGDAISSAWNWYWDMTTTVWSKAWEYLKKGVFLYIDIVKKTWSFVGSVFSWFGDAIKKVAKYFGIEKYINPIIDGVKNAWDSVIDSLESMVDWLSNLGTMLWDSFKSVIGGYWDRIKNWAGVTEDPKIVPKQPVKKKNEPKINSMQDMVKSFNARGLDDSKSKNLANRVWNKEISQEDADRYIESNRMTSDSTKKIADEAPKQSRKLIEQNSISRDLKSTLSAMSEFVQGDMIKQLGDFFTRTVDELLTGMRILQEQERQWSYMTETGSLAGYGSRTKEFAAELKKLEKPPTKEYAGYEKGLTQINQNSQSIVNNNGLSDFGESLRKGRS